MKKEKYKILDLNAYKIERALREEGFTIKRDEERNINILLKINNNAVRGNR